MEAPRYLIEKLSGFAQIPDDRLDACLKEFKSCVFLQKIHTTLFTALGQSIGLETSPIKCGMDKFTWIDDGDDTIYPEITWGQTDKDTDDA